MLFRFEIPDDKIKTILKSGSGKVKIYVTISTIEKSEKSLSAKEFSESIKNALLKYNRQEQRVINAWNNHPYIVKLNKSRGIERRNYPLLEKDCTNDFTIMLKKIVRKTSASKIEEQINLYLNMCEKGEHVWDKINHGFKSLYGFLHKLYLLNLENKKPWWDNQLCRDEIKELKDDNPKITKKLIDAYAEYFLQTSYNIDDDPYQYGQFVKFRKLIIKKMKKGIKPSIEKILSVAHMIFDACESRYSIVTPGNLISKTTWSVLLPQYIKKMK
jgi:hypothetical protein